MNSTSLSGKRFEVGRSEYFLPAVPKQMHRHTQLDDTKLSIKSKFTVMYVY